MWIRRCSLSEVAGSKLLHDSPHITDLSDFNRPTKIAEQFSEIYDDLWVDVFEKLCQNSKMSDRDAIRTLLQYLEVTYKQKHSKTQNDNFLVLRS